MLKLTVREKTFRIDFVSNEVLEKYTELTNEAIEAQRCVGEYAESISKTRACKNMEEAQPFIEKAAEILNKKKDHEDEAIKLRWYIIEQILESNRIEFVKDWWYKFTSAEDLNDFMLSCVKKDFEPGKESGVKKNSIETG